MNMEIEKQTLARLLDLDELRAAMKALELQRLRDDLARRRTVRSVNFLK